MEQYPWCGGGQFKPLAIMPNEVRTWIQEIRHVKRIKTLFTQ